MTLPNESLPATILVVDDEAPIRLSFRYFLEDHQFNVLEAENGRVGLEIFREKKPDMVLVDLRMPEMDGLEVLAGITKQSPETPIIVVSGTGVIRDVVEALHLGAWDYILKPIEDMTILLHAVQKSLERARLVKENREYREQLEEKIKIRNAQLEATHRELEEMRAHFLRPPGDASSPGDSKTNPPGQ